VNEESSTHSSHAGPISKPEPSDEPAARPDEIALAVAEDWRAMQSHPAHAGTIRAIAFSPDGTLLASTGDDCTVTVRRVPHGEIVMEGHHHAPIDTVAFSRDGRVLICSGRDHAVHLCDLITPDRTDVILFDDPILRVAASDWGHGVRIVIATVGGRMLQYRSRRGPPRS
jgi:WD40 repeat protein